MLPPAGHLIIMCHTNLTKCGGDYMGIVQIK